MSVEDSVARPVVPVSEAIILRVVAAFAAALVLFGFLVDSPAEILRGRNLGEWKVEVNPPSLL